MRDEISDAALVVELDGLAAGALVGQDDAQAAREERRLAQPLLQRLGGELHLLEDLGVRKERDRRAGVALVGVADDCDIAVRNAARELLAVHLAVAANFCDQPLGERVHDGDAHAVQAAGDLVGDSSPPNLPPACSFVRTTVSADVPWSSIRSTGMPEP